MVGSSLAPTEGIVERYRPVATALLEKHGLTVPPATCDMLARTIMRCRELGPRQKRAKGKQLSPRDRLRRARTHAVKLIEYAERQPSRRDSIPKRAEALRKLLNDLDATVWLSTAPVRVQVPELLERLRANPLDRPTLDSLLRAIESILSSNGAVTGRPIDRVARIVRSCCIAWWRARRSDSYRWDGWSGQLEGGLPAFARDVLSACGLQISDDALRQQLDRHLQKVRTSVPRVCAKA